MNERNNSVIMLFAFEMFFDEDDFDEVEETNRRYFIEEIQTMNSYQFKRHFRMSSSTFKILLGKLNILYQPKHGHPELPLSHSLLICIWYLANLESFR